MKSKSPITGLAMKRKKTSDQAVSECFFPAGNLPCDQAEKKPEHDQADSPTIDFRAPEFNVTDDLDDNVGNYRDFQKLDGIMTADMLHQEERKKKKRSPEKTGGRSAGRDRKAAAVRTSDATAETPPLPLTIISKGRVLVIGADVDLLLDCGELLSGQGLSCSLCLVTNIGRKMGLPEDSKLSLIQTGLISVSGGFGGFYAATKDTDGQMRPIRLQGDKTTVFDLVLDLQALPAFAGKRLPMGYYAPGMDKARLGAALRQLPEMKGRFTKPQFTVFREDRCLYGLSRVNNCQRCLKICPVSAVRAERDGIFIDQHLCQGCGGCALVCPADAIEMINPAGNEPVAGIRDLLAASFVDGAPPPVLVIHPEDISPEALKEISGNIGGRPVMFGVAETARIGPDILLAALAYGASSVIMILSGDTPADIMHVLESRQRICAAVLRGLDMQEDRVALLSLPTAKSKTPGNMPYPALNKARSSAPITPAPFSPESDRRTLFRLAVRHLYDVSEANSPWISLPADAPFGAIDLDKSACTLCMSCVGVCPTGALSAGNDHPLLFFAETDCHQCGLCSEACPEDAVQLLPRIFGDADNHQPPAVLHEAEPFTCIECGEPFAAPAMIKHLEDKLAGHWMYSSDRQIRRLRMCRTCRTRDALLARDFQR